MRSVRFLVVDDSAISRSLVTAVIRTRLGAERIFQACDGRDAILLLEDTPVDIIISDWNMSRVSGDELLAYVRRNGRLKHIPFIMVSSNRQRDIIVDTNELGITHYLVKPFTPAELEQKIRNSWNMASKRKSERHAGLPQHQLSLTVNGCIYPGTVVNLSRSGALLRVKYGEAIGLYKDCALAMTFTDPNSGRRWEVSDLRGTTLRLEADGGDMCLVAVKFDLDAIGPSEETPFAQLIHWLAARAPLVISA
jgi:two-component system chemotaxis response regulator CheY